MKKKKRGKEWALGVCEIAIISALKGNPYAAQVLWDHILILLSRQIWVKLKLTPP